jgi:hypothetical protein
VQTDANGMVLNVLERRPEVRRIKLKTLTPDKNLAKLASDIVESCKYIHQSRVEEVEQLLIKLRKHVLSMGPSGNEGGASYESSSKQNSDNMSNRAVMNDDSSAADSTSKNSDREKRSNKQRGVDNVGERGQGYHADERGVAYGGSRNVKDVVDSRDDYDSRDSRPSKSAFDSLPPADMNQLDEYLEMLYQVSGRSDREKEEGLKMQERGTAMILKLCRDVINLEQLIQNSTVMGALTRVLQEEYKKSVELSFNILR